MCLADLSIGAAGGFSWERCCLELPTLLVILADNQVSGANALEQAGAAMSVKDPAPIQEQLLVAPEKILNSEFLMQMCSAAAPITDG